MSAAGVDARDFVDSATLTAAAVVDRSHYVVLDAGWRSATATRVAGGAECVFEEAFVSERANLLDVYDLWLIAVAAAMVKNTRFDPLLSLDVEQRLFADLPALAARAATEGKVDAVVEADGVAFLRRPSTRSCSPTRRSRSTASSRASRASRASRGRARRSCCPPSRGAGRDSSPRLLELEQDGLVIAPAGIAAVAASLQGADLPDDAAPAPAPRARWPITVSPPTSNTSRR